MQPLWKRMTFTVIFFSAKCYGYIQMLFIVRPRIFVHNEAQHRKNQNGILFTEMIIHIRAKICCMFFMLVLPGEMFTRAGTYTCIQGERNAIR